MIRLLTGPIRSYKTTTLLQWSSHRDDVGGILTPDVDGLRHLYNIRERRFIAWEKTTQPDDRDLVIGRFVFDHDAFVTAIGWLEDHLEDASMRTIILDEIGPLELQGKGWDAWLLRSMDRLRPKEVIFVVRQNIVEKVVERYGIEDAEIVDKSAFPLTAL